MKGYNADPLLFSSDYTTCDLVLFYELAFWGRFYYLREATTVYRIQSESVSISRNRHKAITYTKGVLYIEKHFIEKYKMSDTIRDNVFRRYFQSLFPYVCDEYNKALSHELRDIARDIGYQLRFGHLLCYVSCMNKIFNNVIKFIISIHRI